jgi:outer membrane protein insertion porin family
MKIIKITTFVIYFFLISIFNSLADNLKGFEIVGNKRITDETIMTFLPVSIDDEISVNTINEILKELYDTNFFKDVDIEFENNFLRINVLENPIIQNITYEGIKSQSLKEIITDGVKLVDRSSYVDFFSKEDRLTILKNLRKNGYFFSTIDIKIENLENNTINLIYQINLGKKAKIKKITFLGNKIFKDKRLNNIILSEEYKFWKFISGKKYLNEELVNFDKRLLINFYKNNGYYSAEVSSSFAKLINDDEFELIFNIDAGNQVFFGRLEVDLPINYKQENFLKLSKTLSKLEGKPYSINSIEKITQEIDLLAISEEYETIDIDVIENFNDNNLNITFAIKETEKFVVKKINISGNNVTRENVIRNQFEIDEGDFYNDILMSKTINNLKSLNFFKDVASNVIENSNKEKIININVEEKATGEIGAAAGVGTSGSSLGFFVKENNYLGRGITLNADIAISEDSLKGLFSIKDPNFNDTDKSIVGTIQATEINKLTDFGYKTSKTGFSFSTNFEVLDDMRFGAGNSNYYEKIETDSTASTLQKKQEGNYWDSFIDLDFDYDKRNQKFRPSDGFRSVYGLAIPLISETNTISNIYNYTYYTDLYKDNVTTFSFYAKTSNSLSNDNIKLTERNFLPYNKLRGFESGKVGPKDGKDYIGGNFASSINITTNLPNILEQNQNIDLVIFLDAANIWGVDYSSAIDDSNKIRSSTGVAFDWFSPLGPLNFSLSLPLTKAETDKTETFRFNLGTTF